MNDLFPQEEEGSSLMDIAGELTAPSQYLPEASIKNRAASVAALTSDPSSAIGNYRAMVAEAGQGKDYTQQQLLSSVKQKAGKQDLSTVMGILSDPTQSMEAKKQAMEYMRKAPEQKDTGTMLLSSAITKPNEGENAEQSDVRISIASVLDANEKARTEIQGLINAHGASLPDASPLTMVQAAEAWLVPFANSYSISRIVTNIREKQGRPVTMWDYLKNAANPGAAQEALVQEMRDLPPEQRVKMAKDIVDVISKKSSIIIPTDNHFVQMQRATELLNQGGYDSTSAALDTLSNVFDLIGLGGLYRSLKSPSKGLVRAAKGIENSVPAVADVAKAIAPAERNIFELAKAPVPPTAAPGVKTVSALEAERAKLLGNSGQLLERGQVANLKKELAALKVPQFDVKARAKELQAAQKSSYKEAITTAERELADKLADHEVTRARIQGQLDSNASSAKNEQRIAELDNQISQLKNTPQAFEINKLADAIQRIDLRSNIYKHNPAAPGNILSFGNPSQARSLHIAVLKDTGEEFAQAMFGASRTDVVASNIMPQVTNVGGTVLAKTPDIEQGLRAGVQVDPNIMDMLHGSGSLNYTAAEKASARAAVVNDFKDASGLSLNDAMSSFTMDGDRIRISAMFGGSQGGFAKADDAAAQAIASLRKYDVNVDNIKLMGRKGVEFVELDSKNVPLDLGEYYVRVDTFKEINAASTELSKDWDTRWNFFDRISGLVNKDQGSLTRHLFTSNMVVDPIFTKAASRVSDFTAGFEKLMLDIANQFAEQRNMLGKAEQQQLDAYIKEANFNEIAFDQADLIARGFSNEGIEAASLWRKYWDNHFYLENYDMVRTLNAHGYQKFTGNGTELFVKPVAKNQNLANVFDSTAGKVVKMTAAEGDALYNSGGSYARLRRPTVINGERVEHVVVRNNLSEYTRVINDNDRILNYKNGYFQIQYKAPIFVDEIETVGGVASRRAIAVAGDSYDAETFASRMRSQNPNKEYTTRGDYKAVARSGDDWWDLQEVSGRIAQNHRGQLLQDATGINHLGDTDFIVDPVSSAIRAARSISGRTIGRPFLEAAKARVLAKYADVFPKHPVTKEVMWPVNVDSIKAKGVQYSEDVRDARTMYEYVNYLENGYINSMDGFVKGTLNSVAAMLGKRAGKGSKIAAKGQRIAGNLAELNNPASLAKNSVFTAYIGLNPLRQLIVQPHQAVRMFAYDPVSALDAWSRRVAHYSSYLLDPKAPHSKEVADFGKFIENSGMMSAVDKHNLVRGALLDAAQSSNPVTRNLSKAVQLPRQLGFDSGERMNMLVHLGTVYNSYKKKGLDVTNKAVAEEAYAEARAIALSMNFAGDMPYNQNFMGFALQFMQIPHKALLQIADRQIPVNTRLRLIGADVMMFGPPSVLLSELFGGDILPDNPDLREMFVNGLEQWGLNKIWSSAAGSDVDIDYSSLNSYDISGWKDFFTAMFSEGGIDSVLMNSASGGLFLENAGKVQNLIRSVGRLMGIVDDPLNLTDLKQVGIEAARLASGFSNAEKAMLLLETEKRLDAKGSVIDDKANYMDAMAQLFGFGSYDARQMAALTGKVIKANKEQQAEWSKTYNVLLRYYTDTLATGHSDPKWMTAVTGHLLMAYRDDPEALQYFRGRLANDMRGPAEGVISQVMKLSGRVDAVEFKDAVRMSNASEEDKKKVLQIIDDLHNYRGTNK